MNPESTPPEGLSGHWSTSETEKVSVEVRRESGPQAGAHGFRESDAALHAQRAHPDWEYATTEGPRKRWDDADTPPASADGEPDTTWQRNTDVGRDGWERFDHTEESYWRRPKQKVSDAVDSQSSPEDQALVDQIAAAIYEWSCQPYKWPDAHPHDVLAYRADAHAVMAAVVKPLQVRARIAEAKARELEGAADVAVRAVQLMQQAGIERDAAEAAITRVRGAIHVADDTDVTDWQRGYRACAERALAALDGPKETPCSRTGSS